MNFPKYWARGRSGNFHAWRWSSQSLDEAQALANQTAKDLEARFDAEDYPTHQGSWYYPTRPFREQILQEIKNGAGETAAVVTRNAYGCEVLNTARVMFVDIDLPEPRKALGGIFQKLFGKSQPAPTDNRHNEALAKIESWTQSHPEWGWRIYRTRAGLRLLATQDLIEADSEVATGVFDALGSDPLYRTLCKSQKCYRARLTPKPWRCGIHSKPDRWPFLEAGKERQFIKWEADYRTACADWATCELLRVIGNSTIHPEIGPLVKLHDDYTRAETKMRLA